MSKWHLNLFHLLVVLILPFMLLQSASAAQITIAWDPESRAAGYDVYYRTASGVYGSPINVGNVTTYTLTNLSPSQTYVIGVTAYNGFGESAKSELQVVSLTTSVNPTGAGTVNPPGVTWHSSGQNVSVSATVNSGYAFNGWSGDLSGSTNPSGVVMDRPKNVTANFTQNQAQYTLTVNIVPSGVGSVTKNPNKATYGQGETVQLTATANAGYTFSNWSGDASGSTNPVTITMNANRAATANFTSASPGSLSITPSEGLSASGSQGGPFSPSSKVYTLQNLGGSLINWSVSKTQGWVTVSSSGGSLASGASTTVTVSINGNANSLGVGSYSDTVTFSNTTNGNGNTSRSVALTVSATGQQTFTVATNPSGLQVTVDGSTYGAPQSFSWVAGSSHTLSVPSSQSGASGVRYVFASWSDGRAQTHTVVASSSNATYTANFTTQYSLTTSVNPAGAGTVNPSGVTWYDSGQNVSVSATAGSGYTFNDWSGDLSGSTITSSVVMNGPKNVTANFSIQTGPPPKTVSTPRTPRGPNKGTTGSTYAYVTGGSVSDSGGPMEYQFDWEGDGTTDLSPWGFAKQSKMWKIGSSPGTYAVRARTRPSTDRSVVSDWSGGISVSIAEKPFIHVTSPKGGETWVVGAKHTISWDRGYLDQAGTIYLFYWYSGSWHPIAPPIPANSSTTSYDWTIPDSPPGLESVFPKNRVTRTLIWVGNLVNGVWQCWGSSGNFKILDDGWVFTISGADKGGATLWFNLNESSFDGYGISLGLGMFRIQGSYSVDTKGVISGTYLINDFGSGELASGNITGRVDANAKKLTLKLDRLDSEPLFNMSGVRLLGEPDIPANWTAKISGNIQGNFSSLTFEPFQDPVCGGDCAHIFKVSGSGTSGSNSISIDGYFFFIPLKTSTANTVYGIYDHLTIGRSDEPGYFSGTLNPNPTKGKFSFKAVSDSGDKYTFSGQVVPP